MSVCGKIASAISIRKGTSLATSPRVKAMPIGSFRIKRSGGLSQPVAQGEISRASQPEGATRKASPSAAAAWGRANRGDRALRKATKPGRSCRAAIIRIVIAKAASVEISPVPTDKASARDRPGHWPSIAKPWPETAGASVPASPAAMGSARPASIRPGARASNPTPWDRPAKLTARRRSAAPNPRQS